MLSMHGWGLEPVTHVPGMGVGWGNRAISLPLFFINVFNCNRMTSLSSFQPFPDTVPWHPSYVPPQADRLSLIITVTHMHLYVSV